LHDAKYFEAHDVPIVAVATTEFVDAGRAQAKALAFDVYEVFPVAHPIQPLTEAEVAALARGALAEITARLVGSPDP
jgi:hypothetical protein